MNTQFEIRRPIDGSDFYERRYVYGSVLRASRGGAQDGGVVKPAGETRFNVPSDTVLIDDVILLKGQAFVVRGIEPLGPWFTRSIVTAESTDADDLEVEVTGIHLTVDRYTTTVEGRLIVLDE